MSQQHSKLVTIATLVATTVAIFLLVIKSVAFFYTGAVSILASMIDSLMDIGMSLVNVFAVRYALMPPDKDHRFGHGKAESLAGLAQSCFIAGSALVLLYSGGTALVQQKGIDSNSIGVWVMLASTFITFALVAFQRYVIKLTNNAVIKADSLHYVMDIMMNGAVLLALLLIDFGWWWADGLLAVLISLYIMKSAWDIGYQSIQDLLDRELSAEIREEILEIAKDSEGVLGAHDLRTRQSGNTKIIQLHIELLDKLSLFEAHEIGDRLEARLIERWEGADVIIHQDPRSIVPANRQGLFVE
ncbi:cation diffusion facilitator family transporter [Alginatibacterium sediminis]|uniref:Cation-efflux pump FieF n=1 Tax=Alginatibacterium sediminis TaxID=2164068 RepID=A0A420E5W4_9ALTE|nr:cation diffusion facilitator family transporter [Alginatibacterium sediminis]RKF13128.1 cation diffusion facilitator family transporter [Alginatibacterium sediminis]